MFRSARAIVLAICSTAGLLAQGTLSGPSLGFVFDSEAKAIRPILGIPGSATLGPAVDVGGSVAKAAVSPQQDFVLAFSSAPSLLLVRFDSVSGSISVTTNANISTVPDLIAISPSGKAAALFYRDSAQIQVLTGLPQSADVGAAIDVSGLPNSLDTMAILDNGQSILAGFPENTMPGSQSGEVYVIPADGTAPRSILTLGHAASINLLNPVVPNPFPPPAASSQSALVADDAQNALYRITDVAGAAAVSQVFGPDAQIAAPFAVQPSPDNQKYFVVAQSGAVVVLDVNGADPVRLQCTCKPTGLHRLKGNTSYQLTESSDGLIWILDWDPLNPRFLFVPPAQVSQ